MGFRFIFSGTQLFDVSASNNEDHKVWRPLWFHTRLVPELYFHNKRCL